MGAIITLSVLGILVLYLGLYNAKKAMVPVTLLGLVASIGFLVCGWNSSAVPLYEGMILFDRYAIAFSVLCIVLTGLVLGLSKDYFEQNSPHTGEYFALILFSLTGAVLVSSFHHFALLFVGVEIMSVAAYVLAGIRKKDFASNEAA